VIIDIPNTMELIKNKIEYIIFFMAILNIIRHLYYVIQAWVKSVDEAPVTYIISDKSIVILGISISYILTCMVFGITS
jgi:hypothetical protein